MLQLKHLVTSLMAALILAPVATSHAQSTNNLSDAEINGLSLAQQLANARPAQNLTNTCIMQIRGSQQASQQVPLLFETTIRDTHWTVTYKTLTDVKREILVVTHSENQPTLYQISHETTNGIRLLTNASPSEINSGFAGSDFWLCDLGLEFLHWPAQKVLPKTPNMPSLKRSRAYTLLESINPHPATNGYSRVVCWIDQESGGILQAEAYDFQGKKLKTFEPKNFEKVNGQWQLEEMQIWNDQTGSRTKLVFDLEK